jgi:cell division protein FtsL
MSLKKFFIILFAISITVAISVYFYPQTDTTTPHKNPSKHSQIQQKGTNHSLSFEHQLSTSDDFILVASLITSMLSFIGFILSSYYSVKGHSRDEELFDLQKEKEKLEMEKIRAEIQALRRANNV